MEETIPIGLTLSRNLIPQVDEKPFLKELQKNGIFYKKELIPALSLKSSQGEFDNEKINDIMLSNEKNEALIFVSNDNYILDGHHRWIAKYYKKEYINAIKIDLPILELLRIVRNFKSIEYKKISQNNKYSFLNEKKI